MSYYPVCLQEGVVGIGILVNDITERRQVEETLRIRNNLYAMLSRTDRAVRQSRSRDKLFQEVCTIAVETGHFRFAWIGAPGDDRVQMVASAGINSGYMEELVITLNAEDPRSQGPTGRSLLSDQITVVNDVSSSAMMAPGMNLPDALVSRPVPHSL